MNYTHLTQDERYQMHPALRCQKARRKRYGARERRGTIPNQVSIEQRPAIVDSRKRFGDWEGDLVIGAGQQQALVTLNERKSRYIPDSPRPFQDCTGRLRCHDLPAQALCGLRPYPYKLLTYRSRLMVKLDVSDVPSLVKFALEHGLTPCN